MAGLRPKQLVRLGMFYLEEAILDILLESRHKGECSIGSAEIGRRGGGDILRGMKETTSRDWIVWHILKKLEAEGRVETNPPQTSRKPWRLTEEEFEKRHDVR